MRLKGKVIIFKIYVLFICKCLCLHKVMLLKVMCLCVRLTRGELWYLFFLMSICHKLESLELGASTEELF